MIEKVVKMCKVKVIIFLIFFWYFFYYYFLSSIRMVKITAEKHGENHLYSIRDEENKLWIRNKDIGDKVGVE